MNRRFVLPGVRTAFRTPGRVAPGSAARWAERLFCRPPRASVRPKEEDFLASGRAFGIASSEGTLAARDWEAGPTMVTHGPGHHATMRDLSVARQVAAFLAEGIAS